ncbi:MAG: hypothetical protein DKT66_02820 [Candidatus Melainabacteria bacterium]|nr:MAG: hypothetical protein DKT66_02820 [Candidatus Melainabacteria bacterium]
MSGKLLARVVAVSAVSICLPTIAQTESPNRVPKQTPGIFVQTPRKNLTQKDGAPMQKPDSPAPNPSAVTYPGMTRYVDLKGYFSVLMRGTPDKDGQFELVDNAKYSSVSENDKQGKRSVSYADVLAMGKSPYDSKKQSAVIQQQTQAYIEKIHGKMNSLKAHAKYGYQFRDISGRIDGSPENRFRLNAYLSGNRMFIVAVEGKEDWVKSAQADAFFNSFEVPGATAVPKLNVQ